MEDTPPSSPFSAHSSHSPFATVPVLPPSLHLSLLVQGRGEMGGGGIPPLLQTLLPLLGRELELADENGEGLPVWKAPLCCFLCLGHTPLMLAASRGNAAAVSLLLDHGANIHHRVAHWVAHWGRGRGTHHRVAHWGRGRGRVGCWESVLLSFNWEPHPLSPPPSSCGP